MRQVASAWTSEVTCAGVCEDSGRPNRRKVRKRSVQSINMFTCAWSLGWTGSGRHHWKEKTSENESTNERCLVPVLGFCVGPVGTADG